MNKVNLSGAPSSGQLWPEQGGIYAGRLEIDGELYGIVFAPEYVGELSWDEAMSAAESHGAGGFNDWALPTRYELLKAWGCESLRNTFAQDWYWSSSQYSPYYAWVQSFNNGCQINGSKYDSYRVRPVRRFKIENSTDSGGGVAGQPKWQPIETVPECEHILILVDGQIVGVGSTYHGDWWSSMPNGEVCELDEPPTNWMPLPGVPE